MSREEDRHPEPPLPDAEPSAEELEQARALAAALEGPALDDLGPELGDDVAEGLATSEMIRAGARLQPLELERREAILDEVLAEAPVQRAASRAPSIRRLAPLLALAASVVLVAGVVLSQRGGDRREVGTTAVTASLQRQSVPGPSALSRRVLSRPSNELLGRPIKDRAGAARRLDRVFADRLAGYRQLVLAQLTPGRNP